MTDRLNQANDLFDTARQRLRSGVNPIPVLSTLEGQLRGGGWSVLADRVAHVLRTYREETLARRASYARLSHAHDALVELAAGLVSAPCRHPRREKFDSHRCHDCGVLAPACEAVWHGDYCERPGGHDDLHSIDFRNGVSVEWQASVFPEAALACGICGEREGSSYAKGCCTDDNMVEV